MVNINYLFNFKVLFLVFNAVYCGLSAVELSSNYLTQIGDPQPQVSRDPFSPSALMYDVLNKKNILGSNGNVYGMPRNGLKIPKITLRGFIEKKGNETLALLDITGSGTQMVREGDEITFNPAEPHNKILITEISRKGVVADMGMMGTFRILK